MKQINAKILGNRRIKPGYYRMAVSAPGIGQVKPGQFANIRVAEQYAPLLRKPLSIFRKEGNTIEFVYRVVGRGTEALSKKARGMELDMLVPLGNGYGLPAGEAGAILVGGGTGIASLYFLAEFLSGRGFTGITVLLGARDGDNIICEKEFRNLGCRVLVSTEDGCRGYRGCVTGLMKKILGSTPGPVYSCGPAPMLKEVVKIAEGYGLSSQVSLESYMGCGVGACMSCVVKIKNGNGFEFRRACSDGPVFDGTKVIWE